MTLEEKVQQQMTAMLADQFYHQPGKVIQIDRDYLIDMLTKQTMHGMEVGVEDYKKSLAK